VNTADLMVLSNSLIFPITAWLRVLTAEWVVVSITGG